MAGRGLKRERGVQDRELIAVELTRSKSTRRNGVTRYPKKIRIREKQKGE